MSEWTREELLLRDESVLDRQDAIDDTHSLRIVLGLGDAPLSKLTDWLASNYRASRRVWAGAAFEVCDSEIDRLTAANAALVAELAELKARLAVRQSDRECAEHLYDTYHLGEPLVSVINRFSPIIAAHVAARLEPWRKRQAELEWVLEEIRSAWADTLGEKWAALPLSIAKIDALLAQSPTDAEGGRG